MVVMARAIMLTLQLSHAVQILNASGFGRHHLLLFVIIQHIVLLQLHQTLIHISVGNLKDCRAVLHEMTLLMTMVGARGGWDYGQIKSVLKRVITLVVAIICMQRVVTEIAPVLQEH